MYGYCSYTVKIKLDTAEQLRRNNNNNGVAIILLMFERSRHLHLVAQNYFNYVFIAPKS